MAVTKVPPKSLPWLLVIFGVLGLAGLVGLMSDNNIWPFNLKEAPKEASPAPRAPATTPAP
jgi:hypothetical protein